LAAILGRPTIIKVMTQKEIFIQFIDSALTQLNQHRQVAFECEVEQSVLDLHDKLIDHCGTIKELVSKTELSVNYINQFQRDINQALGHFPFRGHIFNVIQEP
jgi:hypothetical protein